MLGLCFTQNSTGTHPLGQLGVDPDARALASGVIGVAVQRLRWILEMRSSCAKEARTPNVNLTVCWGGRKLVGHDGQR